MAAASSAVAPSLSADSRLAPAASSAPRHVTWPALAAHCTGVRPFASTASMLAPAASRARAMTASPTYAASCSGVQPLRLGSLAAMAAMAVKAAGPQGLHTPACASGRWARAQPGRRRRGRWRRGRRPQTCGWGAAANLTPLILAKGSASVHNQTSAERVAPRLLAGDRTCGKAGLLRPSAAQLRCSSYGAAACCCQLPALGCGRAGAGGVPWRCQRQDASRPCLRSKASGSPPLPALGQPQPPGSGNGQHAWKKARRWARRAPPLPR